MSTERLRDTDKFPHGDNPDAQRLPALRLDNVVRWANPALPLNFTVGKPTSIPLFFDRATSSEIDLEARSGHNRSGDLGKTFFRDTDGSHLYRDIDIKGCGFVDIHDEQRVMQWEERKGSPYQDYLGLLDRESAEHDTEMSEKFTAWGIRTHRSAAIIDLKELPIYDKEGTHLASLEELRTSGWLSTDFEPVIQIRAFGTKARIGDLFDDSYLFLDKMERALADSINLVRYELHRKTFSLEEYLLWFAESLGKSMGIMHKHEYVHKGIGPQNITLDSRIVDLDSVRSRSDGPSTWHNDVPYDSDGARITLMELREAIKHQMLLEKSRIFAGQSMPNESTITTGYMESYWRACT